MPLNLPFNSFNIHWWSLSEILDLFILNIEASVAWSLEVGYSISIIYELKDVGLLWDIVIKHP